MGEVAAERVLRRVNGEQMPVERILVPTLKREPIGEQKPGPPEPAISKKKGKTRRVIS
jgi:hypothetical protein